MYTRSNIALLVVAVVLASYWILRLANNGEALSRSAENKLEQSAPVTSAFAGKPSNVITTSSGDQTTLSLDSNKSGESASSENEDLENTAPSAQAPDSSGTTDNSKQTVTDSTVTKDANTEVNKNPALAAALELPDVTASKTVVITLSAAPKTAEESNTTTTPDIAAIAKPSEEVVDQPQPTEDSSVVEPETSTDDVADAGKPDTTDSATTDSGETAVATPDQRVDELNDSDASGDEQLLEASSLPIPTDRSNADVQGNTALETNQQRVTPTTVKAVVVQPVEIETATTTSAAPVHAQHRIVAGDTLYSLARRYNTTVARLKKMNNLQDDRLFSGEVLLYPGKP